MSDALRAVFAQIGDLLPFRQESDALVYRDNVEKAFPPAEEPSEDPAEDPTPENKTPVGKTPVAAKK